MVPHNSNLYYMPMVIDCNKHGIRCLLQSITIYYHCWDLVASVIFFSLYLASAAHQARVTVVLFVLEMEWLLSTGQDKNFSWHCSESGQQLGTYRTAAWVSGLQYPLKPNPRPGLVVTCRACWKMFTLPHPFSIVATSPA